MLKKSLAKNVIYAFALQVFNLFFPLITAPYLSHVLGTDGLGNVGFAQSVVGWVLLFCCFGTDAYGMRAVARVRENHSELSKVFSELVAIKIIFTTAVVIIYIPLVLCLPKLSAERMLFFVYGITLILSVFSIDWFFQGIEEYKYIANRSILVKLFSFLALFVVVRKPSDYVVYAGILVVAFSFNNVLNFVFSRRYVHISFTNLDLGRHFPSLFILFIGSLIVSVYNSLDQVLLGFMKGPKDVAFFSRAKMIMSAGMAMSITISNVIAPRITESYIKNRERYDELLIKSAELLARISLPIAIGVLILSRWIMVLLGGEQFLPATTSLMILSPLLFVVPLGIWNYTQRIMASGNERSGLFIQMVMAGASLAMNLLLIPRLSFLGASVSYTAVETLGAVSGFILMNRRDHARLWGWNLLKPLFAVALMATSVLFLCSTLSVSWLAFFVLVLVGAIIYAAALLLLKDHIMLTILDRIRIKINHQE